MSALEIKDLINTLPSLVMYLIPGYILIWILSLHFYRELEKDNHIVLKSIVLSYLLVTSANFFLGHWDKNVFSSNKIKILFILFCAI